MTRRRRPRGLVAAAATVTVLITASACTSEPPVVPKTPPEPREEVRPNKPGTGVFWQSGHWAWDDRTRSFYWVPGGWVRERPDRLWIPGYWKAVETDAGERGWVWVEPRWDRRDR